MQGDRPDSMRMGQPFPGCCELEPRLERGYNGFGTCGGVAERLMAAVLKTARAKALGGSNPSPSAALEKAFGFGEKRAWNLRGHPGA
jgi:hypothetical protein